MGKNDLLLLAGAILILPKLIGRMQTTSTTLDTTRTFASNEGQNYTVTDAAGNLIASVLGSLGSEIKTPGYTLTAEQMGLSSGIGSQVALPITNNDWELITNTTPSTGEIAAATQATQDLGTLITPGSYIAHLIDTGRAKIIDGSVVRTSTNTVYNFSTGTWSPYVSNSEVEYRQATMSPEERSEANFNDFLQANSMYY